MSNWTTIRPDQDWIVCHQDHYTDTDTHTYMYVLPSVWGANHTHQDQEHVLEAEPCLHQVRDVVQVICELLQHLQFRDTDAACGHHMGHHRAQRHSRSRSSRCCCCGRGRGRGCHRTPRETAHKGTTTREEETTPHQDNDTVTHTHTHKKKDLRFVSKKISLSFFWGAWPFFVTQPTMEKKKSPPGFEPGT